MQVKGQVTYILRDAVTEDIILQKTESNVVTDRFLSSNFFPTTIGVSEQNVNSDPRRRYIYDVKATGTDIAGIPNPEGVFTDTTPFYSEWRQRFNAPAADITIRTIVLGNSLQDSGVGDVNSQEAYAYLALTSPCIQTTTQILDVFYRIQFINPVGSNLTDRMLLSLAQSATPNVTQEYQPTYRIGYWKANIDKNKFQYLYSGGGNGGDDQLAGGANPSWKFQYGKTYYYASSNINQNLGRVLGTVGFGPGNTNATDCIYWHNAKGPADSNVQSVFRHGPTAALPFFDSLTSSVGDGLINVDGTSWTDPDWPKMYRVEFNTTGPVGASTYRFKVRNTFGFNANTYQDLHVSVPYFNSRVDDTALVNDPTITNPWGDINLWGLQYSKPYDSQTLLQYSQDTIVKLNMVTGDVGYWNSTTTPALPATDLTQIEVDSSTGEIWIACRATGLHKISSDGLTITTYDATTFTGTPTLTNQCYGVAVGNGKIWGAFEGGIAQTSNNGSTWISYDDTTTPSLVNAEINNNWDRILWLRADPSSGTDDIALIYGDLQNTGNINDTTNNTIKILWWDLSTGTTVVHPDKIYNANNFYSAGPTLITNSIRNFYDTFVVSDTGLWALGYNPTVNSRPEFYTHGLTTKVNVSAAPLNNELGQRHVPFVEDANGNPAIYCQSNNRFYLARPDGTATALSTDMGYTSANTSDGTDDIQGEYIDNDFDDSTHRYLGNGVFVGRTSGFYALHVSAELTSALAGDMEREVWTDYGWNGSAWVQDEPGNKTTHAGAESLHDGLTISFDNNGDQFVSGDYYTFGVLDGVWLDGASEIEFETSIYTRPIVENVTDFEVPTLSASPSLKTVQKPTTGVAQAYTYLNNWITTTSSINQDTRIYTSSTTTSNVNFPTNIRARGISGDPLQGDFHIPFSWYRTNSPASSSEGFICGLTAAANSTQSYPGNDNHITHGFYVDTDQDTVTPTLYVREAGVNVFTYSGPFQADIGQTGSSNNRVLFAIERVGTTINYYYLSQLIYTSVTPLSGDQHLEVLMNNRSGIQFETNNAYPIYRRFARTYNDYWAEMGSSVGSTGKFDPDFYTIDAQFPDVEILLDGTPVTTYLVEDLTTPLNTGEVSIFPLDGLVRYSSADAGKTISATYNYIKNA